MSDSPRLQRIRTIDPSVPSNNYANITDDLPRRHCSLLFQLRSGHAPLNKFLHRIAKSPTAQCQQCNEREESTHHFIMSCHKYARQRAALRAAAGSQATNLQYLLSNVHGIKELLKYIARTRRLEPIFGDVTPPDPKEG
ncbi:hypothetical protein CY34DRAFT_17666 [Suillus luteus UH-Slu-Lm8-n1]|uniref:Reverse transcriptase zinc-binding domain-containing protein n=1 Tax=Suillus luteus UH-Slu-Lm8-n1 TaxID=930992 RepID=A0A0D0A8S8_9AGAM|nr:hypothetical protein CY34DRAFT_17666 [Suillus luteus UH-Slu-Lm8-n1]